MLSKLNQWINRAAKRPLTKEEITEFAHEINRPILEPLINSPAGFVSLRPFEKTDIAARVCRIPWFTKCGSPLSLELTMPIRSVTDWPEAVRLCACDQWETAWLEAQNQLTLWLCQNALNDYRRWNEIVRSCKSTVVTPSVDNVLKDFCQQHNVSNTIISSVNWAILGAMMENEYLYTGHQAFFFFELLEVYEAGHFPCGWDGAWPNGNLCVF